MPRRGEQKRHILGFGPGHNAESRHQFYGQLALTRRDDPDHFGRIALGSLEHRLHLFDGGGNDRQGKRPLLTEEQIVHVGNRTLEFEMLGGIRFLFCARSLGLGGLPLRGRLDDVIKGGVNLGFYFCLGDHPEWVRDGDKTHVGEALALLRATGEIYKGVSSDGDCGDTGFFNEGLVNYQP